MAIGGQHAPVRDNAPKPETAGTAVITGRVLAGDTDRGVAAAGVFLYSEPMMGETRTVLTDRAGRFTVDKLPARPHRLSVMPPKHSGRLIPPERSPRPIDLEAGAIVEAPPVRLPFGASVSGHVVDERGEPVAAIPVYALADMDGSSKRQRTGRSPSRTISDAIVFTGCAPARCS